MHQFITSVGDDEKWREVTNLEVHGVIEVFLEISLKWGKFLYNISP